MASRVVHVLLGLFVTLFAFTHICQAQGTPPVPGLTYLYTLNCTLAPAIDVGATPTGTRMAIPITGGTFTGPRLNGTILDLGADWGLIDSNGKFSADTRYQLRTNDGADIYIQTAGPTQDDGTIHLRMIFQTGSAEYSWLNYVVAVGILHTIEGGVKIDAWQLTSPTGVGKTTSAEAKI